MKNKLLLFMIVSSLCGSLMANPYVKTFGTDGKLQFTISEKTKLPGMCWPESLVSYPVEFTAPVAKDNLRLLDMETGKPVVCQLSNIREKDGKITFALVNFMTDLPSGAIRRFELSAGKPEKAPDIAVTEEKDSIVIDNGKLKVRIPQSSGKSFSASLSVPAPIMQIDRGTGWMGENFLKSKNLKIVSYTAEFVEKGSLFAVYRISYRFEGGASYAATVKLVRGYDFVDFHEEMKGMKRDSLDKLADGIYVDFAWTNFKPEYRFMSGQGLPGGNEARGDANPKAKRIDEPFVMNECPEDPKWHDTWMENPAEEMTFRLSPFSGNFTGTVWNTISFWNPAKDGANMGLFVLNHEDWQDMQYANYVTYDILQVQFRYAPANDKKDGVPVLHYLYPLSEGTRHTGLVCNDYAEGQKKSETLFRAVHKPEEKIPLMRSYSNFLHSKYSYVTLDRYKDWILGYPKTAKSPDYIWQQPPIKTETVEKYMTELLSQYIYTDQTNFLGCPIVYRGTRYWVVPGYVYNREKFTPEQYERLTALLLLHANVQSLETNPMRTMVGGATNLQSDGFYLLGLYAWLFPEHPSAKEWAEQFCKNIELMAAVSVRPEVKSLESKAGRWLESPAIYCWAYMEPTSVANYGVMKSTGLVPFAVDTFAPLGNWFVDETGSPVANRPAGEFITAKTAKNLPEKTPEELGWKPGMPLDEKYGFKRGRIAIGAHSASATLPVSWTVNYIGNVLRNFRPIEAEHMLWLNPNPTKDEVKELQAKSKYTSFGKSVDWELPLMNPDGNAGTNPHLKSCKYTGFGTVLRAAVGEADEIALWLFQTDQGNNYRWGHAGEGSCGLLTLTAGGKTYTGYDNEATGDEAAEDTVNTTNFGVYKNRSYHAIGQNLLEGELYDFDVAQYTELLPRKGNGRYAEGAYSWPEYQGRNAMLVGSDYFLLMDEVNPGSRACTRFSWFVPRYERLGGYPFIYFIEPSSIRPDAWHTVITKVTKGFHRQHNGTNLALVTPKPDVKIEKARYVEPFGRGNLPGDVPPELKGVQAEMPLQVSTSSSNDLVFRSHFPMIYDKEGISFSGCAGVIRNRKDGSLEMALLKGNRIGNRDLAVTLDAASAFAFDLRSTDRKTFAGNLKSKSGGKLTLSSANFANQEKIQFYLDGAPVEMKRSSDGITVNVFAGRHKWELCSGKPTPMTPEILRTVGSSGATQVFLTATAGAENYVAEVSEDGGKTWSPVSKAEIKLDKENKTASCAIGNLQNGKKYHVRVTAVNSEKKSEASKEYPVYATDKSPNPPAGLRLRIEKDQVSARWGEVLGVKAYRLYRRPLTESKNQDGWKLIHEGLGTEFIDKSAKGVVKHFKLPGLWDNRQADMTGIAIYEYAVTALNGNGEGEKSVVENSDPRGWLNWFPEAEEMVKPQRRSGYMRFPYIRAQDEPPMWYPK